MLCRRPRAAIADEPLLLARARARPSGSRRSTKSSKLVSCWSPYCRRNSLKRGTPRSRSRMRSSAGDVDLPRRRSRAAASSRFCRNCGWFCSVSAPSRWRPMLKRPVGQPALRIAAVARPRNVSTTGTLGRDRVGIAVDAAELDQVRHQRVQPVDGDELLGEVERRAEVVDAAVHVVGFAGSSVGPGDRPARWPPCSVAAEAEDARPDGEDRVPAGRRSSASCDVPKLSRPPVASALSRRSRRPRTGRTSWRSCRGTAARRRAAASSTRWCGSWRSRRRRRGARPRRARRRHVAVADHRLGRAGSRRPESASGVVAALAAEVVDEEVVLAREHVVIEAHPDRSSYPGTPIASWPAHSGFIGSRRLRARGR